MTTMAQVLRTRSRGTYTTILTPSTKQPCTPLDCAPAHCDPPQSATPLESDQRVADNLFSDFTGMSADWQDIGYYKVALNLLPHDPVLTYNIDLPKRVP